MSPNSSRRSRPTAAWSAAALWLAALTSLPAAAAGRAPGAAGTPGAASPASAGPASGAAAAPAAAAAVPAGIVGWLGPIGACAPAEARQMAAEALARIDLAAVDDGDSLRIAQSKTVARRFVYPDGRVVEAGTIEVTRDWVAKVVDAGSSGGKPMLALSVERAASPAGEPPPPPPPGATEQRDQPADPAFDSASLWLLQRAKVDKSSVCKDLSGIAPAVRAHAQAQCGRDWIANPGSLADPELFAIGNEVRTGFIAVQFGPVLPASASGMIGLSQGQWLRTSRQSGWITTTRAEVGASYHDGLEIAGHVMLGLSAGGDKGGLALLGGVGLSGVSQGRVDFGLEAVARLQARFRTPEGEALLWFEPAWIASEGRSKGSPSLPWADGLRTGLYYGRDGSGVHSTGLGVELWEVQGVRVVQLMVGLATVFGKW